MISIISEQSTSRNDLIYEVLINLFRIQEMCIVLMFLWVPAHVGVQGN